MGKPDFRLDIQGLRAVAALLVAIFHIWVGRVSGGVDVFFVVSGYLITRTLAKQLEVHGKIRFADFWARLVRRLFPAAFTVLAAVLLGALLFISPTQWRTVVRETAASALYYENWQLALTATDYLDREDAASPLQHYWALAVQGQFYIAWPFLMSLGAWTASKFNARRIVVLRAAVGATFAASFAYSVYATAQNQPFAYFDTRARLWEFALGAGVALIARRELSARVEWLVSWVGLLLILSCGALLKVSRLFPGYAALWPAGAALCILLAGSKSSRSTSASRLLGSRPLVLFGEISYAFYLWHWPVLVFTQNILGRTTIGFLAGLVVLASSTALAILTTYLVEAKTRDVWSAARMGTLCFTAIWLGPVLVGAVSWHLWIRQTILRERTELPPSEYPGALALANNRLSFPEKPVRPSPLAQRDDLPKVYADGCHQTQKGTDLLRCEYGVKNSNTVLALVGSSHAAQWLPPLEQVARNLGWKIVTVTKASCPFRLRASVQPQPASKPPSPCDIWNEKLLDYLLQLHPAHVFTTATRAQGGKERLVTSSLPTWEKLTNAGISLLAIRDTPWVNADLGACVEKRGRDSSKCSRLRADLLAAESPTAHLSIRGIHFLDLNDLVCEKTLCRPVVGNILVYRDKHHLSATYASTLAPFLEQQIVRALGSSPLTESAIP